MANKIRLARLLPGSFEERASGLVPRKGFFFTIRKPLSAQDYKWVPLNCEPETNRLSANCCISNIYINHLQHGVLALGVKDLIAFVTHLRFSTFKDFLKSVFKQNNQQLFILKTSVTETRRRLCSKFSSTTWSVQPANSSADRQQLYRTLHHLFGTR